MRVATAGSAPAGVRLGAALDAGGWPAARGWIQRVAVAVAAIAVATSLPLAPEAPSQEAARAEVVERAQAEASTEWPEGLTEAARETVANEVDAVAGRPGTFRAAAPQQDFTAEFSGGRGGHHWCRRGDVGVDERLPAGPLRDGRVAANLATGRPHHGWSRVEYRHDVLVEWYLNTSAGVEQGFTLPRPPKGGAADALRFETNVAGDLQPVAAGAGRVDLVAGDGVAVLRYAGLHVFDADGDGLPATSR